MNWIRKDGTPALLAVTLFLMTEILRLLGVLSQYWESFEIICNAMMLGIAIFFSAQELSSRKNQNSSAHRVIWIVAVSLLAFPMNIDVFGHVVRLEQLLTDLWGWHSLWIACAALQLLILTPLGMQLLTQFKLLLAQFIGFLKWGKGIAVTLGNILSWVANQIMALIKESNSKTLSTIVIGIFLWVCWLVIQLSGQNTRAMLADIGFWGKGFLFWPIYLLIVLLLFLFPFIAKKVKDALLSLNPKHVLAVVVVVAACMVSVFLLPFLQGVISITLILVSLLVAAMRWASKRDKAILDAKRADKSEDGKKGDSNESPTTTIKMGDLITLVLLFVIIPTATIFLLTLFTPAGKSLILGEASGLTAWLNFWTSLLETTNSLLQLFGAR